MAESKVKKFFTTIDAWIWCDICDDMVALNIDKKEIIDGLKMSIYTKEYRHSNPHPDVDEPDDLSGQEHSININFNDAYDIKDVRSSFDGELPYKKNDLKDHKNNCRNIPIVIKDIPPMAVQFGMLNKEQFKVLKICDGMNTIEHIVKLAQEFELDDEYYLRRRQEPEEPLEYFKEKNISDQPLESGREKLVIPNRICLINFPHTIFLALFTFLFILILYYFTNRES